MKTFSGRRASQSEYELREFINVLKERKVTRYLEIGARHGDTFNEVMVNLPVGSYGMAVDLPGGMWGRASSVKNLHEAVEDLRNRGYFVDVILGDSTTQAVIDLVANAAPFDAAFIDGDHRYEGVKADWLNYRDFAPLVAFHDIVGTGQREKVHGNFVEVPRLWQEIAGEHPVITCVEADSLMGIGICLWREQLIVIPAATPGDIAECNSPL